ncbi:hypothetical protein [Mycolicibacter algericus]|uniref:Uncharacterized protein n=2 Tax=Mycolicibacter algericus TaxID=1288388 RepID=A0A7I9YCI3_MYCAL|nr:hypothetical protein [Mycolicibacter algericus]OQZ96427.1 hypothetical protein BST10_11700 [Mycolicibacter algericus DSM 45454]GFG86223.1 hypothetical protein MALGJ_28990 [Mycolicibacter algericus]
MSILLGVTQSQLLAKRGGTLAAATVLAGAGLVGVAAVGPELPGSPFGVVQHETALIAFPTFAESLQTLLDDFGMGDLNGMLGGFGTGAFNIDSSVADFLAAMNPTGITLNGLTEIFGLPLDIPLYSATAESLLGFGSDWLVDGVPIGNVDLGDLIDVVLGDGAGEHSLQQLANALNLGSIVSQYGNTIGGFLANMNVENCNLTVLSCDNPDLNVNNPLVDWLSGILGQPTADITRHWWLSDTEILPNTAWTLGQYLHELPISTGSSTMMDAATLGQLFGMNPGQTWDEYVSNFPFGGTLLDPSGEIWGDQTLGTLLSSFLPEDSDLVITGDTPITDILEAFGLLW